MRAFWRALLVIAALTTVAATPAGVATGTFEPPPAPGPGGPIVPWDGSSPMVEGTTYAMPECWPLDAKADKGAPCLVSVTSGRSSLSAQTSGDAIGSSVVLTTDQITCGVNVTTRLGTLVAKLWETITITWYEYTWSEVGASRGTWVKNSMYSWTSVWGPTPGSGTFTYVSNQSVRVGGIINYLGAPYHQYEVRLFVHGNQNYSCSVYAVY